MRRALPLLLLAACELQPAPKKQAAPPPPPPTAQVEAAKPVEQPPPPPTAPKLEINAQCLEVSAKIASVFIDSATDPGQKSIYEQDRANMSRKMGEACMLQGWSDEARACYLASKSQADLKACETKFPVKRAPPQQQPSFQPVPGNR